ncbi:universal stress protein [Desulfosporosinus sp. BICA1-9]|uniref:universal stress protein n=1 Tax=Desulfosporosinus sp. BICA1-9 TaxID=1531958 RepID=UPI00054B1D1C|nr:universal stress protein [Desulfosporosinus sp. BICA1-9]KJS48951.1 MAG: universal stress protein [Peptococcaceae bacterium BRH_c23]KJS84031.1 MAG: universal stress protein [Desulfosporosinus sp. BICA1-9]HBW33881.1 universal stress protein [Desulfosporosinus sp.]
MNDAKFNVLLYFNDSQQAFYAAVHTAILLKNMPNMHLTVVQVQEGCEDSKITEYSWIDTKDLVNWALAKSNGKGNKYRWPISSTSNCLKHVFDRSNVSVKNKYHEILSDTNGVFLERAENVNHVMIYCNPGISETLAALYDYASKNSFNLIIMGTQGLTTLKVLLFGLLINNSPIPLMLIKKLPQVFNK